MLNEWFENLATIASEFNALTKSADAKLQYDLFADAISWSDELPSGASGDSLYLFRSLVHYRTGLIINEPKPAGHPFWLSAKEAFPNWPGFDEDRCRPDEKLADFYRRAGAEAIFPIELEAIFSLLDDQFDKMVPRRVIEKRAARATPPDITAGEVHELVCRCLRLAQKDIPADAWQRVRDCITEGLNIGPDLVTKRSWLRRDLGAGQ